jgi:amino acid adenylation domain-containing protein
MSEAIRDGDTRLTYAELDSRANQLAHLLRSQGVGPGVLVGICLERSAAAIVAVLGILKAGGAYVPLDPEYPREWLAHMLADSQVRFLVTRQFLARQQPTAAVQTICLDTMENRLAEQPATRPDRGARPHDPAYVIYTSGSTGKSKGVVVEHRSVVYSTHCRLNYYSDPVERFALFPSLAFDASVAAIFWTLSQGGTLCLPAPGAERDPARLSQWIAAHKISHWLSVPALYRLMLDRPVSLLRSLRTVVLGGESCPPSLVRAHFAALPNVDLFNEYGPTEATVWSTVYRCDRERADECVPIGRPLPDTRLYVLDERRRLVAPGEAGELYIAGPGVARGYWQQSQLTSERFLVDPFSLLPDGRLYRTGDRVRRLADGNFEFLGRVDTQAKVRGNRVELGQVEAALGTLEGVAQAVVVSHTRRNHEQLVAYLVPRGNDKLSPARIRKALGDRLPSYMIPAQFVTLDALPLTPRGKIDRHALPLADSQAKTSRQAIAAPVNDVERRLLASWEAVFGQAPLGVCDDFFELGGDSLLAAGLFARVEADFGQVLPPETLLDRPTVRRLAELLQASSTIEADSSAVRIRAGRHRPPLFCLPGIGGHVLEFREFSRQLREPHAVYGLRPAGLEDGQAPHDSIEAMAAHAIRQMRCVQPRGPYALVGYSLGGVVAFEMARQLKDAGQGIALLALLDSRLWSPKAPLSVWQRLRLHWQNLYHSSHGGRCRYLRERGRLLTARIRRGSWRQADDDVVLGLALSAASRQVARQHWRAWRAYQPGPYDGDVMLFVAQRHPEMPDVRGSDPTLGWSRWTSEPVDVLLMNATHAEMLRPESSKVLAISIQARLARTVSGNTQNDNR